MNGSKLETAVAAYVGRLGREDSKNARDCSKRSQGHKSAVATQRSVDRSRCRAYLERGSSCVQYWQGGACIEEW